MEQAANGLSGTERTTKVQEAITAINKRYSDAEKSISARVSSLFRGNQFLVFVYQRFNDVRLVAELEDGTIAQGETQITASLSRIRSLRLEPEQCLPLPEALAAIRKADVITVGPGSLYTSILPNLLVARVARAIGASHATKIFICNLMTQPGETDGYTARQHLETVKTYAPEIHFDFVVVNDQPASEEQRARYALEGAHQIGIEKEGFESALDGQAEVVRAALLDEGEKARHNSESLANVVFDCWRQAASRPVATV